MADTKNVKTSKAPVGYERAAELAETHFADVAALGEQADRIKDARRKAARPLVPKLKRLASKASASGDALREHVRENPDLFRRPRTRELGGVKVGYRNLPDKIEIDPDVAVPLIRKHLPGQSKVLINTKVSLNMKAVKALAAAKLRKIGGRFVAGGQVVVASIAKSSVDRLVEALLSDLDSDSDLDLEAAGPGDDAS